MFLWFLKYASNNNLGFFFSFGALSFKLEVVSIALWNYLHPKSNTIQNGLKFGSLFLLDTTKLSFQAQIPPMSAILKNLASIA